MLILKIFWSTIPHDGKYWLFGSDHSGIGAKYNAQLEIWYSRSPLGPWRPHKKNPMYNTDKSMGARNGGRPFLFDGFLYRVGQDDCETYGRRVRLFKIKVLTTDKFKEVEVPMGLEESIKGRNAWNGARMFSWGNLSEKLRMGQFDCKDEVIVDLFAGIGYFVLPFLVRV